MIDIDEFTLRTINKKLHDIDNMLMNTIAPHSYDKLNSQVYKKISIFCGAIHF